MGKRSYLPRSKIRHNLIGLFAPGFALRPGGNKAICGETAYSSVELKQIEVGQCPGRRSPRVISQAFERCSSCCWDRVYPSTYMAKLLVAQSRGQSPTLTVQRFPVSRWRS